MDHEIAHFPNGNYETNSTKLADQIAKCRAVFERSYSNLRLAERLPELASKLESVNCSLWSESTPGTGKPSISEQAFN